MGVVTAGCGIISATCLMPHPFRTFNMAKSVQPQKQLSLVSFMTTKEGSSDDKHDDQGEEPSSSDTDEMLSEPSCSTVPESRSEL